MLATISCLIQTDENLFWKELQKPSSLFRVASPILKFVQSEDCPTLDSWELNTNYKFKLFLFTIIPFGEHVIRLVEMSKEEKRIVTNEHGSLTRVWNHTIVLEPYNDSLIRYTDIIEIEAGLLTAFVWLFSHIFYRHRQRKWKKFIRCLTN